MRFVNGKTPASFDARTVCVQETIGGLRGHVATTTTGRIFLDSVGEEVNDKVFVSVNRILLVLVTRSECVSVPDGGMLSVHACEWLGVIRSDFVAAEKQKLEDINVPVKVLDNMSNVSIFISCTVGSHCNTKVTEVIDTNTLGMLTVVVYEAARTAKL